MAVCTAKLTAVSSSVNISLTVATPAGLITPIVKVAAEKSIQQIFADVKASWHGQGE